MTAAAIVLATAVALIWLAPVAGLVALRVRERRIQRQEAARRAEQGRVADRQWLAVLAATDTPIFAEVWADTLRRDLEEWA